MTLQDSLKSLLESARKEISQAVDGARAEQLRVKYLGKKGELSAALSAMGKLPPKERRAVGEVAIGGIERRDHGRDANGGYWSGVRVLVPSTSQRKLSRSTAESKLRSPSS